MEKATGLVRQARRGSASAFASLYQEYYLDLYRFALYTLKNRQDAEDVVGDTVADAWAQIGSLKKVESFKSWIFKILSNKCRQRLKGYLDKAEELPEDLSAPVRDHDEDADVRTAFARLDDEERLILSMNLFGGYTSREIGEALGMNDNTVLSRQKLALEKMAGYLGCKKRLCSYERLYQAEILRAGRISVSIR